MYGFVLQREPLDATKLLVGRRRGVMFQGETLARWGLWPRWYATWQGWLLWYQVRDSEYGSVTEGTTMGYLEAEAR